MRLKYQVFLALLLASALLIALMYAISSWSFSKGLLDYANQSAMQRAEGAATELEVLYAQRQSWDWAHKGSDELNAVLMQTRRRARPGARGRPEGNRPPPYVLADASKRIMVGPPRVGPDMQWLEIGNEGVVVGHLGFRRMHRLDSDLDKAFEQQQKQSFAYAGFGMVLLCALMAIPIASLLLKPLLRMGNTVELIRNGDYSQRLAVQRKDELGELSRNIDQLAITLDQNRSSRQRWIAEISHELRTPMAVLRSEIEALQDGVRNLDQGALGSLHSEVMRLGRLVDDLHTLSLSDVGALDYKNEVVALENLLTQFLESKAEQLDNASLSLRTDFAEPVSLISGDSQRLLQLFSNLFQNSLRYTDEHGSLVISTRDLHGQLQIVWSDSSPGVPAESLSMLFDPLYRVEQSRNRASGGSGLGLSIARRIVEAHAGSIEAQASELGGLRIDIRLPLRSAPSAI